MKHHVIYVPGLGDRRSYGQPFLLWIWRFYGLTPHYHAVGWADNEAFNSKLQRLLDLIDNLKGDGEVTLMGASAGASAVLTAYSVRPESIKNLVCISGKINNGDSVGPKVYAKNPAFKESMAGMPKVLNSLNNDERPKIMSIHPLYDQTVPIKDTMIPDALERQVPIKGHVKSIFYCLTIYGPKIATFIKD